MAAKPLPPADLRRRVLSSRSLLDMILFVDRRPDFAAMLSPPASISTPVDVATQANHANP
jgi:hypothetical protein